jgi:hypothetical protein
MVWGALLVAAGSAASAAGPGLPSVFGQPLGEAMAYPECRFETSKVMPESHLYDPDQPGVCYKVRYGDPEIIFPIAAKPAMLSIDSVFAHVIDGRVEGIATAVVGDAHAQAVIAQLSEKFGKPTSVRPSRVVVEGVPLSETVAVWIRAGYRVDYHSISDDLEHGELTVRTDRAVAADDAKDAASNKARVSL